jgi:glycerophosphoryl diester phosphodiesterase
MPILRYLAFLLAMSAPTAFGQLIIGHRGASHDAPENTLAAFRLALEQGADGFEADFYLTSDGHVICFHDQDTERICGTKLLVTQTPFDVLRKLDVGRWKGPQWQGQKMATLEEVLAIVPKGKKIFIELKSGPEIVEPMAKVIERAPVAPDQIVIISFHVDAIAKTKQRLPAIRAHWLSGYEGPEEGPLKPTREEVAATIRRIGADGFGSKALPEHFDADFIEHLRDAGCHEFHVWTVNEPEIARVYQQLGAWSITTDRPGWLREQLGNLNGR